MSSPNDNIHDTSLLDIGKKCTFAHCGTIDFLPFKCEHCTLPFCSEHFRVDDHKCAQYDESKHNRVAPHCPLCDEPVAIPQGQDPIIRLQAHVDTKCPVTTGKKPGSSSPRCGNRRCNKVLISPIRCDKCRKQFCPAHRFPSDHTCASTTSHPTPTKAPAFTTASAGVKKSAAEVADSVGAKASAASVAIKRSMANNKASAPAPSAASKDSKSPAIDNPFSKTNRRAKAENESRFKAMEHRAKKGLLSEQEKVIFAQEQAARGKSKGKGSGEKDCVVM